jgi:MoxR-like ATPase
VLVEGSAELTPARLIGSFDLALVLEQGYRPENFSGGPLVRGVPSPARWRRPRLWNTCRARGLR